MFLIIIIVQPHMLPTAGDASCGLAVEFLSPMAHLFGNSVFLSFQLSQFLTECGHFTLRKETYINHYTYMCYSGQTW